MMNHPTTNEKHIQHEKDRSELRKNHCNFESICEIIIILTYGDSDRFRNRTYDKLSAECYNIVFCKNGSREEKRALQILRGEK